jgi:hypothetical protein
MDEQTKRGKGRPRKEEEISIEEICEIMLKYGKIGGFYTSLPAFIHKETDILLSRSYLDKLKDPDYLRTKSVAMAYCSDYWTEQAHLQGIPSAMWKFIMQNVSDWRDNKTVILDAKVESIAQEPEQDRLDRVKTMISEVV